MTLREEIAALRHGIESQGHGPPYRHALDDVLVIIDRHEANRKEYGETRCTRCGNERPAYCLECWEGAMKTKPSEERPAREKIEIETTSLERAVATAALGIMERIDANTAAIRETHT